MLRIISFKHNKNTKLFALCLNEIANEKKIGDNSLFRHQHWISRIVNQNGLFKSITLFKLICSEDKIGLNE